MTPSEDRQALVPGADAPQHGVAATQPDREYARWLGRAEQRAVLPLKWSLLLTVVLFWLWGRDWELPPTRVFAAFFIYGSLTAGETYLFWRDRVSLSQMPGVAYVSYLLDLVFITIVIYLDTQVSLSPGVSRVVTGSDFYVLYFLLIMRGFLLFRSPLEHLIMAALLSILFLSTIVWQESGLSGLAERAVALRFALLWAVMLLATFILDVLNKQKDEVLRARERLVRSEGLAALGELTAGVAHEINNPIGIIKTYAEYLERASRDGDPNREDYTVIRQEAERCERLIRRMLDFANPEVRTLQPVDMVALTREVLDFVFGEKGGSTGLGARLEAEERLPTILGDAAQLRQALLNIVMNARQVSLEHQEALKVEGKAVRGHIEVRVRQLPGPRAPIEIAVHDNGPGIDPEDAERAFEPFFTRRAGGTGLGLAITRRIVEAHSGTISIWPAANGGTTCAVTLPISSEEV